MSAIILTTNALYNSQSTNSLLDSASTAVATAVLSHSTAPVAVITGSCPIHLVIAGWHRCFECQFHQKLDFLKMVIACSSFECVQGVLIRFGHLRWLLGHRVVEFTSCNSTSAHNHSNH